MIIIDSDNYTASGIETLFFPGGEPHAKVPIFKDFVLLHLKLRTWTDVGLAACVLSALASQSGLEFKAFIPYFPGARQDHTDGTAPLTVHMMAELLGYTDLVVFDPHSDVLSQMYHGPITALMPSALREYSPEPVVGVIAPDTGATVRALNYLRAFHPHADLIQCHKKRNPQTGFLSNYRVPKIEKEGKYVIVDDICDGGGTFNLLVEEFFSDPVGVNCSLNMFVSHGIFSKGLQSINPYIEHITTTDSWCRPDRFTADTDRLTVIPLLPNLIKYLGE